MEGLPTETAHHLRKILLSPEDTIGAHLNPRALTLFEEISAGEGLKRIKENISEASSTLFVLTREYKLVGYLDVKNLIAAKRKKPVRSIMKPDPPQLLAEMSINLLLKEKGWIESFDSLAVVNSQEIFLGTISRDTLSKIDREEKTGDIQARQASLALGNLYQIGFSSLFRTASEVIWDYKSKQ
jgi:Mg/Co/Ni transporter MgtE